MMVLNFKIRLYSVEDDVGRPEQVSPFFCHSDDTYADLCTCLENEGCVERPIYFGDFENECRILKRFEAINPVIERIYVIPTFEGDGGLYKRCRVGNQAETRSNDLAVEPKVQITVGEAVQPCDADFFEAGAAPTLEEVEAGEERNPIQGLEFPEDEETLLQSTFLPTNMLENYKQGAEQLRRELESLDFADHKWDLETYDHYGVTVVKIFCGECKREIGGTGRDHSRSAVQNLFSNFKKNHLHSTLHIKQWCRKRQILYSDHPKKEGNSNKPIVLTPTDHRQLVEEGVSILQSVNDLIFSDDPPFVIVRDVGVP